ncbi:MAG: DUF1501 domain-containing protein [Bacteroidota bacterium]
MKRRNFLRTAGALSLPALLKSGIAAAPLELFTQFINPDSDRVLVLIRLSGGNDGLNTLIGLDQLANLRQVRPNVALPDSGIIGLTPTVGLHGNMTGMKSLFDNGQLSAIQAVGYPNQNRSHFRSTDIWTSASPANEVISTGWMGRYLDELHPDFPTGYPNDTFDYPLAMTMGNVVSETCQGISSNFIVAVNNPFNFTYIATGGNTALPENYYGDEVMYVRALIGQSNQYGDIVQEAANAGTSMATNYTDGPLSRQLRNIAFLLSGGLQTKIFIATLGGFDTHSGQVTASNTAAGNHADLMTELSESIKAFTDDLAMLGLSNRVLGMTFSEFGRRIRSNQSNGTDHGDAAPLFLFGDCVQGGILGNNPEIDTQVAQNVGVPFQYDFRDVYGSVLIDWFDVPQATVTNLISEGFNYLPLASACNQTLDVDLLNITATGQDKEIWVDWSTSRETNNAGFTVERSTDGRNFRPIGRQAAGLQGDEVFNEYRYVDRDVDLGVLYYYRLKQEDLDGSYDYSPIQTARLQGSALGDWAVGLVRPNPINERSYVKVYAPLDSRVSWEIFNASGQRVRSGSTALAGRMDTRIGLEGMDLKPGTYLWRLTTDSGRQFARKFTR